MSKATASLSGAVQALRDGTCGGVFIDDTGSPGLTDTPRHLHRQRKSWVAVIVPRRDVAEVMEQFPGALAELTRQTGAREFHFVDVYQGKKAFRDVSWDVRMALFAFMAHIFTVYRFPILVQTLDPDKKAVSYFRERFLQRVGPLDLRKYEELALMLLIIRTKWLLRDELGGEPVRLFLDEGRFKAGSAQTIPGLDPPFIKGEIVSASSAALHPIQLAVFAAFALNRMQLLLGRENLNPRDARLLELISPMAGNFRNIEVMWLRADRWQPLKEDDLIALMNRHENSSLNE